jgi:hypothetical protein
LVWLGRNDLLVTQEYSVTRTGKVAKKAFSYSEAACKKKSVPIRSTPSLVVSFLK